MDTSLNSRILIFGAGVAGLMTGYELTKMNFPLYFIEKEDYVGGLARTIKYNDFLLDIGPHILRNFKNKEMTNFVRELFVNELDDYESIGKICHESVLVDGVSYIYPVNIINALKNAGFFESINILIDYLIQKIKKSNEDNFETEQIHSLGKRLCDLFLFRINEKFWGVPCNQLACSAGDRVDNFSILLVIRSQLKCYFNKLVLNKGDAMLYPKKGIGAVSDKIKNEIDKGDVIWGFSSYPSKIKLNNHEIISVTVNNGIQEEELDAPMHVISTIPITELVSLLDPSVPKNVSNAASKLRYRSHICVYLIFSSNNIMKDHDVYTADMDVPFIRITEYSHFSDNLIPKGKSVLALEYFSGYNDGYWTMDDDALRDLSIKWLHIIKIISDQKIDDYYVHREKDAYPAYDLGYHDNLKIVTEYLDTITNLSIVGRRGEFAYLNQYDAMQKGQILARKLIHLWNNN